MAAGNERYVFSDEDKVDIARIATAAKAAGKPWVMPCWTASERAFAKAHGVSTTVVGAQFYMVRAAFAALKDGLAAEGLV